MSPVDIATGSIWRYEKRADELTAAAGRDGGLSAYGCVSTSRIDHGIDGRKV